MYVHARQHVIACAVMMYLHAHCTQSTMYIRTSICFINCPFSTTAFTASRLLLSDTAKLIICLDWQYSLLWQISGSGKLKGQELCCICELVSSNS